MQLPFGQLTNNV